MSVELATLVLLVGLFVAAELLVSIRGKKGIVVDFADDEKPLTTLVERRLAVRLDSGETVVAKVSGCTACMARFVPGDPVVLVSGRDGYTVSVPWLERRSSACMAGKGKCHA